MSRFSRHDMIYGFPRQQLEAASALVIGAGAVGNEVLKNLCLLGCGSIHIVDMDTIEDHNLTRSTLFRETDVGEFKAAVACRRVKELHTSIASTHDTRPLWSAVTLQSLSNYTCVFACLDNFEARIQANQMCSLTNTPLIEIGIDQSNVAVQSFPFNEQAAVACYQCNLPPSVYAKIRDRLSCGKLRKSLATHNLVPTTIVTASLAGAIAGNEFLKLIRNKPRESMRISTGDHYMSSANRLPRSPICPTCSLTPPQKTQVEQRSSLISETLLAECLPAKTLILSEDVVLSVKCTLCGQSDESHFLQSTHRHTDALTVCRNCQQTSRTVTSSDLVDVDLLRHAGLGKRLDCKYLLVPGRDDQVARVFELTHPSDA
jgi:molybdopterin/thiamine biosynthesis adenylyltransferase